MKPRNTQKLEPSKFSGYTVPRVNNTLLFTLDSTKLNMFIFKNVDIYLYNAI